MLLMDLEKYFIRKKFKENIEADEILLDAKAIKDIEANDSPLERKLEVPISPGIFVLFFGLIILCFSVFFARAVQLQVFQSDKFYLLAEKNRIRFLIFPAKRGIIYDRSGIPLVKNIPSFDVVINPWELPKKTSEINILTEKLSDILNLPEDDIRTEIEIALKDKFFREILLVSNVEHEKILVLEPELKNLPGINVKRDANREYISGFYFSHILGYMGKIGIEDRAKYLDYSLTEKVGKSGLEAQYEKILRGEPGYKKIEINAIGQEKRILNIKQAIAGNGLWLSIDADLQKFLYDQLNKLDKKGIGVAIDPRNGQILALVSLPSFDNNIFSRSISRENFLKIINNPETPLINRVISGEYPAGSTIKPFLAAAGLEEKIINTSTKINDSAGEIKIGNWRFSDWKVHGVIDIIGAIAESCNVFFYHIGGGYGNFKGLGVERIGKYLKLFGFGQMAGIDLPSEKTGLVPDEQWKQDNKKEKWYIGDTYHLSIGQGDLKVTPLQLAMATAAIANNGILYQPQIVDRIIDQNKNTAEDIQPKILNKDFIDSKNIATVREGMRQTVVSGTARSLADLPIQAAGKTGTAQFGPVNAMRTHAWFTAFAPYNNPQIALVILIEGGGEGSSTAVPIAKEVLKWYFEHFINN